MSRITEEGIYPKFPRAEYFADPCPEPSLSQSFAKILIERSPAHAWHEHPRLNPQPAEKEDYSKVKAIGDATHALATGTEKEIAIGHFDNWLTKAAKEFKADALLGGQIPILIGHWEIAQEMVEAMRKQLAAAGHPGAFAPSAMCELMMAWKEEDETPAIWCRSRVDCLTTPSLVYDLKTSGMSCAPHLAAERPSDQGWDVQAAMYERGLNKLFPEEAGRRRIFFIAQENTAPYALTVVQISEADLTLGRKKLQRAIDLWRQCLATNQWPGYPADTVVSHPKPWQENAWLEREAEIEARRTGAVHQRELTADAIMGG